MKKTYQSGLEFILITRPTLAQVKQELEAGKGKILIAAPGFCTSPANYMTGDFELKLLDKPVFRRNPEWIESSRETIDVRGQRRQTGWEKDRLYRLHEKQVTKKTREDAGFHKQLAGLYGQPSNLNEIYAEARSLFKKLVIGKFELEIGFESTGGHGLNFSTSYPSRAYYFPHESPAVPVFTDALTWMTDLWNVQKPLEGWAPQFQFTKKHVERMVRYMINDLKTGAVFAHNMEARGVADVMVGFG